MSGLHIRTAIANDLPRVLDLLDQLREGVGPDTPPELADPEHLDDVWRAIINDPRRVFLVAELDGEVVGTADVSIIPNVTHAARPSAFMERVVVDAQHRGRGVGAALMAEVIQRASSAGCYKVAFLSNKHRARAYAFYRRLGFEPSSEGFRLDLPTDERPST